MPRAGIPPMSGSRCGCRLTVCPVRPDSKRRREGASVDTPTSVTTSSPSLSLRERTRGIDASDWGTIGPLYERLEREELTPKRIPDWILRWSDLRMVVWEGWTTVKARQEADLTDEVAQDALQRFVEGVLSPSEVADGTLAAKLLAVPEWEPGSEHERMLGRLRAAAGVSASRNPDIVSEIAALVAEYGRIGASVAVIVDGRELTGSELEEAERDPDRGIRERAWRAQSGAWLERRAELDSLFLALPAKRRALARDASWRTIGPCTGVRRASSTTPPRTALRSTTPSRRRSCRSLHGGMRPGG